MLTAVAALLLVAAPVSAQLPVSVDAGIGAQTPVGSVSASAQDLSLQACADAYAAVPGVTGAAADACASASQDGADLAAGASSDLAALRANASADPAGAHAGAQGHAAGVPIDEEVSVPPSGFGDQIGTALQSIGDFFRGLWP